MSDWVHLRCLILELYLFQHQCTEIQRRCSLRQYFESLSPCFTATETTEIHEKKLPLLCLKFEGFLEAVWQLQSLFFFSIHQKKYIYIKLHTMVLLVDDLHDHLKSPQDPYVVVALSSLWLSSVYRMPFHLAACCSRTVNSLIAGWKLWKHTAQSTPPSKPVSSAKMILPVESKPLFQINWVWKCCFRCVLDTCCCLSKSYYLTFTQNCPQSSNLYPSETFLWINTLNYYSQSSTPPFQVSCLAMQQISSYISSEIVI